MNDNFEIERKYIIKMPDFEALRKKSDRIIEITQAYIGQDENGFNCRLRKTVENGKTCFIFTAKKKISDIKRIENEYYIEEAEYNELLKKRLSQRNIIHKTRYCVNENGFTYEIDIYPFWQNQAVMEVELVDEKIIPPRLDFIDIIKEVTFEKGYSNFALSKAIPDEV